VRSTDRRLVFRSSQRIRRGDRRWLAEATVHLEAAIQRLDSVGKAERTDLRAELQERWEPNRPARSVTARCSIQLAAKAKGSNATTMHLLGRWNWYLPRWLDWLPRVEAEAPALRPAQQQT
jgi:hypothetical protein